MGRVVAIRHVGFEGLGLFEPALRQRGHQVEYVAAWQADWAALAADPPVLLAVLGGPIGVYDYKTYPFLTQEIAAVGARIADELPTLGICLGAQIIAASQGCAVYPAGVKEIGFADLDLDFDADGPASCLEPYLNEPAAFHWHGDTFDLPDDATLLASTAACKHQAFSIGDHVLAFQFHPEMDFAHLEDWLVGHACELAAAGVDIVQLRHDAHIQMRAMTAKAEAVADLVFDQLRV